MDHSEAVRQMAVEQYLLDELTPEERDAFEEHAFDCRECTLDLRAGAAFVDEAKGQLPALTSSPRPLAAKARPQPERRRWFSWWSPAFSMPAFAFLLLIVGYQNLATIPALRSAAAQPELLPWASVHVGTRGAAPVTVVADRQHGVVLLVDLPQQSNYVSYAFELYDAQGKRVWKSAVATPGESANGTLSLLIPGQGLQPGAYTLAILGLLPSGETTELGRRGFQVSFGN
jgi:anti-sigma factor RsiW